MELLEDNPQIGLEDFMREVIAHEDEVLSRTPEMLPVLKEAGVVDSGGQGLLQFLKGAFDAFQGKEVDYTIETAQPASAPKAAETPEPAEIRFGYCTEFIIMLEKKFDTDTELAFKAYLESIGDSNRGCIG